ncbi:unnamed protein product, partial [Mesorhabditis spiculigera]
MTVSQHKLPPQVRAEPAGEIVHRIWILAQPLATRMKSFLALNHLLFPPMPLFLLLFMILVIDCKTEDPYRRRQKDYEFLKELNDFEIKILRDFVRGRGTASVSRLPFDEYFHEAEDVKKPRVARPQVTRISPKSRVREFGRNFEEPREPDKETFKEYAMILQQLIDVRKAAVAAPTFPSTIVASEPRRNAKPIRGRTEKKIVAQHAAPNVPAWQPVVERKSEDEPPQKSEENWEEKMHDLSKQLHSLLAQIKETKKKSKKNMEIRRPKPKVTVLRSGSAEQRNDNEYLFVASVTLIQDEGQNILVDTGLGTDLQGRNGFLKKLAENRLAPNQIDVVVSTHGHPDHNGGVSEFPAATHYQGWYVHRNSIFNLSKLFESDKQPLTNSVYLIKTPGHTSDDISVIVKMLKRDTFMRSEDIDHPMMWRPLSANETQQTISRRYLLCTSNYLIPGHGPGFAVTKQMRSNFSCD